MTSLLDRLVGRRSISSAQAAKERLKIVLIHDRTDISPGLLEDIKDDLVRIVSQRIEIEPGNVQVRLTQEGREHRLVADIPLPAPSRRRRLT